MKSTPYSFWCILSIVCEYYVIYILKMCQNKFGAKFGQIYSSLNLDNFWIIAGHVYRVSVVFHFSLEGRTMA